MILAGSPHVECFFLYIWSGFAIPPSYILLSIKETTCKVLTFYKFFEMDFSYVARHISLKNAISFSILLQLQFSPFLVTDYDDSLLSLPLSCPKGHKTLTQLKLYHISIVNGTQATCIHLNKGCFLVQSVAYIFKAVTLCWIKLKSLEFSPDSTGCHILNVQWAKRKNSFCWFMWLGMWQHSTPNVPVNLNGCFLG